ncbi:MAG: RAMP superfamily CRISPR-associated protein, partial [Syntrophorhabdaceae bacterium]|nr:RAMP superfamily CRISPR-associated protein [Syntrophorhabdaceae bacterium]
MADIIQSKKVIKGSAKLYLKTPLLLKSGYGDIFSDSTIEKTFDGENIHINGYVWSSFMRRCIGRLKNGSTIVEKIGKYKKDKEDNTSLLGVSPLWCEPAFVPVEALYIRPGNAIDRKYGAVKEGALFNDEIAPQGLKLNLNFNYFLTDENEDELKKLLIDALWVLNSGIENIGGGWSYGLGRLGLKEACIKILDLSYEQDRIALWRFDDEALKD